jgi:PEP-CTERM motif
MSHAGVFVRSLLVALCGSILACATAYAIEGDLIATPEPGTLTLLGTGAVAVGAWAFRRKRKK